MYHQELTKLNRSDPARRSSTGWSCKSASFSAKPFQAFCWALPCIAHVEVNCWKGKLTKLGSGKRTGWPEELMPRDIKQAKFYSLSLNFCFVLSWTRPTPFHISWSTAGKTQFLRALAGDTFNEAGYCRSLLRLLSVKPMIHCQLLPMVSYGSKPLLTQHWHPLLHVASTNNSEVFGMELRKVKDPFSWPPRDRTFVFHRFAIQRTVTSRIQNLGIQRRGSWKWSWSSFRKKESCWEARMINEEHWRTFFLPLSIRRIHQQVVASTSELLGEISHQGLLPAS